MSDFPETMLFWTQNPEGQWTAHAYTDVENGKRWLGQFQGRVVRGPIYVKKLMELVMEAAKC